MSGMIKAIIIDDEQHCIANLSYYLQQYCPEISIVATATTIPEAVALLQSACFDLGFLDIEFCGDTAFSLLEKLPALAEFAIVFVTAYDRYAVKAFKVEAVDYVLKPLSRQEIISCYEKVSRHIKRRQVSAEIQQQSKPASVRKKVILREREHVFIVDQNDILYLKGTGAYTEAVFQFDGKINSILISKTLSFLEEEYDPAVFFRVHKSYLINMNKILGIHKKDVPTLEMLNREVIPIAKRRIHDLLSFINQTR